MQSGVGRFLRVIILTVGFAAILHADTIHYVDDDGPQGGDCSSWLLACQELQHALRSAAPGDQIWVAGGIYLPDYDPVTGRHTAERTATFRLRGGVSVYGGFRGDETDLAQRGDGRASSVLSGDLLGDDGPDPASGIEDNSLHVLSADEVRDATLDGFVITAGHADGPGAQGQGAGLTLSGGNLQVSHCTFSNHRALLGGAIKTQAAPDVLMRMCTWTNNHAFGGAAIFNTADSHLRIESGTFITNHADHGGAILNQSSSPLVLDCEFTGNTATVNGGAVDNGSGSVPQFQACSFVDNSAGLSGGAVYNDLSNPAIAGSMFVGNSAVAGGALGGRFSGALVVNADFAHNHAERGGAVENQGNNMTFIGSRFFANTAARGAGAIDSSNSDLTMINCTFSGNSGPVGALASAELSSTALTNGVVWFNSAPQVIDIPPAETTLLQSNIQGGWSGLGENILSVDPRFVDANLGDLRLLPGSPCIDAGVNRVVPSDFFDLDGDGDYDEPLALDVGGRPRFVDDPFSKDTGIGDVPLVDQGAHEYQAADWCQADLNEDGVVNALDLGLLIGAWGSGGPGDINGDTVVNAADLSALLRAWSVCGSR